ncbi:hypothetical protein K8352_15045 [Flavobacteriaceae bacterium F89]|uniref:Uncharacterized protein n=1 Tax=Cerina litoralis TaxID=2874477 RepID=A0AAE3JQP1_9FLAO|nr:BfmA/BtgA family mobilization protein [Cerina litoralis]MCG2462074.1 hypothetical protein [Cerina litoralis]
MDTYSHINFKLKTVKRFRVYSKQIAKTHTDAMERMLDYFEQNKVSPYESLGPKIITLEHLIKKRFDGLIAIIKNIEKHQSKPLLAIMQSLIQETPEKETDLLDSKLWERLEAKSKTEAIVDPSAPEVIFHKNEKLRVEKELQQVKQELNIILKKVVVVRTNFGRPFYRLNLTEVELENLKLKYKKL